MSDSTITITVAREMGAGGSYLAQHVAAALNYTYIDREILQKSAELLRVQTEQVAGRLERCSSFWERIFSTFSTGCPESIYIPPPLAPVPDEELFRTQREVIKQLTAQGDSVVAGHAGFHILQDKPNTIHVFVHAPFEDRARRVMEAYHLPSLNEAENLVRRTDRERETFVRNVAGVEWRSPHNFDLCINSSRVGLERAGEIVAELARKVAAGAHSAPANAPAASH